MIKKLTDITSPHKKISRKNHDKDINFITKNNRR